MTIELLLQFLDFDNLYSVGITKSKLENIEIQDFIAQLRNNFMGDIFPESLFDRKPITIPPKCKVGNSVENIQKNTQ
jgi:hypothetical protein